MQELLPIESYFSPLKALHQVLEQVALLIGNLSPDGPDELGEADGIVGKGGRHARVVGVGGLVKVFHNLVSVENPAEYRIVPYCTVRYRTVSNWGFRHGSY